MHREQEILDLNLFHKEEVNWATFLWIRSMSLAQPNVEFMGGYKTRKRKKKFNKQ